MSLNSLQAVTALDYYEPDFSWIMGLLGLIIPVVFFLLIFVSFLSMFGDMGKYMRIRLARVKRVGGRAVKAVRSNGRMFIVFIFCFSLVASPVLVAAAGTGGHLFTPKTVDASPGATSVLLGLPLTQKITGLTAATAYDVKYDGEVIFNALIADSNGEISFTFTVDVEGQALVNITLDSTSVEQISFYVEGLDMMIWLQPMVVYGVYFMIIGAVFGAIGGLMYKVRASGR